MSFAPATKDSSSASISQLEELESRYQYKNAGGGFNYLWVIGEQIPIIFTHCENCAHLYGAQSECKHVGDKAEQLGETPIARSQVLSDLVAGCNPYTQFEGH
jgi:hypothetical protein